MRTLMANDNDIEVFHVIMEILKDRWMDAGW